MTPEMTRVTTVPTTFPFAGKKYGPFYASKETPFTEVPDLLAAALNLPRYQPEEAAVRASNVYPESFPERELLEGKWPTPDALRAASDEDILAVDGIGAVKLRAIRAALAK